MFWSTVISAHRGSCCFFPDHTRTGKKAGDEGLRIIKPQNAVISSSPPEFSSAARRRRAGDCHRDEHSASAVRYCRRRRSAQRPALGPTNRSVKRLSIHSWPLQTPLPFPAAAPLESQPSHILLQRASASSAQLAHITRYTETIRPSATSHYESIYLLVTSQRLPPTAT